jgi:hypothetical protein
VGLAQRMEQLAEPGKPLVTEHTAKLVAGFFSVRDLGASRVKGATERMRLYELEGAGQLRTRFDVSRARGLSRSVGRAPEMAALEASLECSMYFMSRSEERAARLGPARPPQRSGRFARGRRTRRPTS